MPNKLGYVISALATLLILGRTPPLGATESLEPGSRFSLSTGYQGNFAVGTTLESEDSGFFIVAEGGVFVEPSLRVSRRSQIKFPITWTFLHDAGHQLTFSPQYSFHFFGVTDRKSKWDPYINAGVGVGALLDRNGEDHFEYPFIEFGGGFNYWFTKKIAFNFQVPIRTFFIALEVPFRAGLTIRF